jgi:hypothetical protein
MILRLPDLALEYIINIINHYKIQLLLKLSEEDSYSLV